MKKLIICTLLLVFITSCKKDKSTESKEGENTTNTEKPKEAVRSYNENKDYTTEILRKDIKAGESFKVKFSTDIKMDNKAWLGIFDNSIERNQKEGYKSYIYVGDKAGQELKMVAPSEIGNYEIRLYSNDPGEYIEAIPLTVNSVKPDQFDITIITKDIKPSQKVELKVSTTYPIDNSSWLGIFKNEADVKKRDGYISYKYIKQNQIIKLESPSEIGDYQIRYYTAEHGELVTVIPLRVGTPDITGVEFKLNKEKYEAGESISINYKGRNKLGESAWLGLFKKGGKKYLNFTYFGQKDNGILTFRAPVVKGEYEMRLSYAEYGPELLKPVSFSITSSLDDSAMKKTLEKEGKLKLYGIYFDTNKSDIKEESFPLIEEIAKMLKSDSSLKIMIEGHTDSKGDDVYNQTLSEKRAKAILDALTSKYAVPNNQLESKGFGETKPIEGNDTPENRSKNRRVELKKI